MLFEPYAYQTYCIDKIVHNNFIGLFLDMGLGKTVITLTAIDNLKHTSQSISKALIIAPLKVAQATWTTEAMKWDHLQQLRISKILGSRTERLAGLNAEADVYIINRDNVSWLVDQLGENWCFDMVVLDESSSFKNPKTKRFKSLKSVRNKINRLVELTGTPTSNGLEDIWAQIYLLDGGQRLGRSLFKFRNDYFYPAQSYNGIVYKYNPKSNALEDVQSLISDICVSMKSEDYLELPDMIYDDIPVCLDKKALKAYKDFVATCYLEGENAEQVIASNIETLTNKLLQLCNGAVYGSDKEVVTIHDCKIEAFMELVEQLNGQHALVFYNYKHDLDRLLKALDKMNLKVAVYKDATTEKAWNDGQIDILLAHPASCGYGLNLQQGGHHIIWFGLTWSLERYEQANKRLHRQGQKEPVIVHRLIVQGGIDEDVARVLSKKGNMQNRLLEALKARLLKS